MLLRIGWCSLGKVLVTERASQNVGHIRFRMTMLANKPVHLKSPFQMYDNTDILDGKYI